MNNANFTINPHDVITNLIPLNHRDTFLEDFVDIFPRSFCKDISLIETQLGNKTIMLSENVKITAPSNFFENHVVVSEEENSFIVTIQKQI